MQTEKNSCEQRANAVMENGQKFISGGYSNSDMNNLTGLDNALKLFMLNEIDNFKHFAKQEADTGSYKLGQELELVTLPSKRCKELVKEMNGINSERATDGNEVLDKCKTNSQISPSM